MIQLAYVSSSCGLLSAKDITNILAGSRKKNRDLGITGVLLYKDGNVLQILEGEEEQVLQLFRIIQKDPRHSGILKLYQKPVTGRDFQEWTMGFQDLGAEDARRLEGFSEVLDRDFDLSTLKPSAAAQLLRSFKSAVRSNRDTTPIRPCAITSHCGVRRPVATSLKATNRRCSLEC